MAKQEFNAKISERIDYGPEVSIFRVIPMGWEFPTYKPGQFAILGLPGSTPRHALGLPDKKPVDPNKYVQRAYSIASSPQNREYIDFYITMVKDGVFTPRLWTLKVGSEIYLSPKISGHFHMNEIPEDKNIVLVATGTGIAPFNSMLQTFLYKNNKRRFALFHGVRVSQDLGYRSECILMERSCSHFNYFPMISRPHEDPIPWKGKVGHVQKLWSDRVLESAWGFKPTPENTHVFLCGSPGMIDTIIPLMGQDGFKEHKNTEPGTIHVERYW